MQNPKAVIDTNVFVAALLGSRTASAIYQVFKQRAFVLTISTEMFAELEEVLSRPKLHIPDEDREELLTVVKIGALIKDVPLKVEVCRDPKDNFVLACALDLGADCIVTCDRDLLVLNPFRNVSVISPSKFLQSLK